MYVIPIILFIGKNILTQRNSSARKDMLLPLSKPVIGVDGREVREIMVPNGTQVIISILGSNTDTNLWGADAHEWKPERWLSPLPEKVVEAHMPGIYSHLYVHTAYYITPADPRYKA